MALSAIDTNVLMSCHSAHGACSDRTLATLDRNALRRWKHELRRKEIGKLEDCIAILAFQRATDWTDGRVGARVSVCRRTRNGSGPPAYLHKLRISGVMASAPESRRCKLLGSSGLVFS